MKHFSYDFLTDMSSLLQPSNETVSFIIFSFPFSFSFHLFIKFVSSTYFKRSSNIVIFTGGPFDLLSRRVVCASSEALAKEIAGLLEHLELERD